MCQSSQRMPSTNRGPRHRSLVVPTWLFGCFFSQPSYVETLPAGSDGEQMTMGHVRICTGTASGYRQVPASVVLCTLSTIADDQQKVART